jgi:hypothetical protein
MNALFAFKSSKKEERNYLKRENILEELVAKYMRGDISREYYQDEVKKLNPRVDLRMLAYSIH